MVLKKDMNQMLIESIIRKTLRDIPDSPKRSIRNIIDLTLNFSNGFQKKFLKAAQLMLQNENSAYYDIAKDAVENINHDTICNFGVNVGYNSCTKGAKTIRQIENKEHFNIPWTLTIIIDSHRFNVSYLQYDDVITQGKALGIYTYLLFTDRRLSHFSTFIDRHPDCAFVLFTTAQELSVNWLDELKPLHNLMISVEADSNIEDTCLLLRDRKLLYSIYMGYDEFNKCDIVNGSWVRSVLPNHPYFIFLFPKKECLSNVENEVYQQIKLYRDKQSFPTFLLDLKWDNMLIDSIISEHPCTAAFDKDGQLHADSRFTVSNDMNLFQKPIRAIFQSVFAKE